MLHVTIVRRLDTPWKCAGLCKEKNAMNVAGRDILLRSAKDKTCLASGRSAEHHSKGLLLIRKPLEVKNLRRLKYSLYPSAEYITAHIETMLVQVLVDTGASFSFRRVVCQKKSR